MSSPAPSAQRQVLRLLLPYRMPLVIAVVLGTLGAAATLVQPVVIGRVVGRVIRHQSITMPFLLLAGLLVAEGVLAAAQVYALGRVGNRAALDLRRDMVRRLLRAPLAIHIAHQRGDLFSTAVADTSLMGSMFAQSLATLAVSCLMILGAIGFMAYLDLVLTGVIVGCVLVSGVVTFVLSRRLRAATGRTRDQVGEFGAALQRALGAIRTVKISLAETREEQRIGTFADRSFRASMDAAKLAALMVSAMSVGIQASFAAVFTVGAFRLVDGALTTATFAAYLLYLLYLITPLMNFLMGLAQFQQGAASAMRITAVTDSLVSEDELAPGGYDAAAVEVPREDQDAPLLRFSDVSFGYLPAVPVLRDLSFELPRRGLTAIVGPSGSGKSTIFALIERFWPLGAGRIQLDGSDIAMLPLHELRGRIGYVEQDTPVLNGTLRENLLYASPDATGDDLDLAIDLANLRDWVNRLEKGLDTSVGEAGSAVSGGERQRIAIARMLLREPDLLLLDEATSQLDAEAAEALRGAVARIAQRCAVVVIAHQITTAAWADHILVVEHGRIRARGTHEFLLATDDLYRQMAGAPFPAPGSDEAPRIGEAQAHPDHEHANGQFASAARRDR